MTLRLPHSSLLRLEPTSLAICGFRGEVFWVDCLSGGAEVGNCWLVDRTVKSSNMSSVDSDSANGWVSGSVEVWRRMLLMCQRTTWWLYSWTVYETGSWISRIWPNSHFGWGSCGLKFLTNTKSPISNLLGLVWSSCSCFWVSWCCRTVLDRSGFMTSNSERSLRPSSNSAGPLPVEVCGVMRWWNRNLAIWISIGPVSKDGYTTWMDGPPVHLS